MASFPDAIASFRTAVDRIGVVYNAALTKVFFAKDYNDLANEIVAIETILGLNPESIFTTVGDRLDFYDYLLPVGDIVGTTDTQTLTNKTLTSPVITGLSKTRILSVEPIIYPQTSFSVDASNMVMCLPSSGFSGIYFCFKVPTDYDSGDITLNVLCTGQDGTGTIKMKRRISTENVGDSALAADIENNVADDITVSAQDTLVKKTVTISSSDFSSSDCLKVRWIRDGNNASDTGGRLQIISAWVEYTSSI